MKKSLPLRLLLTFKNIEPSTLSLKSFRKGGGGGGGSYVLKRGYWECAAGRGRIFTNGLTITLTGFHFQ